MANTASSMKKSDWLLPFRFRSRNIWVCLTGTVIALFGAIAGSEELSFWVGIQLLLLSYPAAFIMHAVNDLFDYEHDTVNKRDFFRERNITPADANGVWFWTAIFSMLLLAPTILSENITGFILILLCIALSIAYSVPPVRLKNRAVSSVIACVVGAWSLYAICLSYTDTITNIPRRSFLYAFFSHFVVTGGHLVDYEANMKAGQKTFVTEYGETVTVILALISSLCLTLFGNLNGPVLLASLTSNVLIIIMIWWRNYILLGKALIITWIATFTALLLTLGLKIV